MKKNFEVDFKTHSNVANRVITKINHSLMYTRKLMINLFDYKTSEYPRGLQTQFINRNTSPNHTDAKQHLLPKNN